MVTGESMPAAKNSRDKLIGGTINGTGSREAALAALDDYPFDLVERHFLGIPPATAALS
jgi:hypothetical protein